MRKVLGYILKQAVEKKSLYSQHSGREIQATKTTEQKQTSLQAQNQLIA